MKPIFFLFLTLTLVISSCLPDDDCLFNFTPQIPITLSPQKDSFHIGDTIWVSADFHHTITDPKTGKKATFRDFDFLTSILFTKIDENPFIHADTMFQHFAEQGKLQLVQVIGATGHLVTYNYNGENYQVKFGFIPQETGLFTFFLSSRPISRYRVTTHSGCKILLKNHRTHYPLNTGGSGNYHLYQLAEDYRLHRDTEESYNRAGSHTFYVVE